MVQSEYVKDVNVSNTIPDHIRTHLDTLLTDNADILTDLPGQSDLGGHAIKLKDEQPINIRPYPIPLHGEETVIKEVKKMLDMGVIEPSNSPYSSPIVLVKKPDSTNRFCIDFRRLNGKTIMDKETIPNQEDLFVKLSKASIFSKIDLTKGYWQIPMDDSSKQYTAFQTPIGLMRWKFMPFGLSNAPATFARTMRLLLDGIPNVISYFDDILIYTQDWISHLKTLDAVLSRLAKHGFTARPTKMYIGFEEIEFLGHVVGKEKLRPEIVKVERILKLSTPKTKKQVKSLLGLLGYYRKFIDNFASICNPLTELLRKGSPAKIEWNQECEDALNKIKHLFSTSPILALPDLTKQFVVRTDASDSGIGGVLLQQWDDDLLPSLPDLAKQFVVRTDASDSGIGGVLLQQWDDDLLPCAYVSRKLLDREKKYSIIEREMLAIVFALSGFAKYLLLTEFVVESDHRPLQYLQKGKANNSRLMRWSLCLQEFRFSIRAIPEKCLKALNLLRVVGHTDWGADRAILLKLYRTLVRCKLDYGNVIYSSAKKHVLRALDPIHHQGLRIALGAFRTFPIKSLYAEAGKPSLEHRRMKLAFNYVLKLKSLLRNPCHEVVFEAPLSDFSAVTKSEPNLVANTFEHFKNANISLTGIDNLHVQGPPPWEEHNINVDTSLTKKNKENTSEVFYQKEFFRIKEKFSNHYAVFTDGSKLEKKVAAAAYFPEHPDRSKATRLRDGSSVFSAELEGIALALTEIKKLTKYHKNFVIYSDSLSALQAIQSKTFKVIDIRRLYNLIRKFPPYVHISFVWVPAHVGIQGNENVDKLVKAAQNRASCSGKLICWSDLKPKMNAYINSVWQRDWDAEGANKLHEVLSNLGEDLHRRGEGAGRKRETAMCRLRVGHTSSKRLAQFRALELYNL
ncbi:reverse transcriptase [Plakobranchus ocellatus]|uniref:Reverse transcriptase n=1 Tax=Plakobranchus ocellatus TaxID=259542 RepID=A0AAV4CDB0_9GAST|nr:reverse transcriptase [Plakobranchus ocellatus]